MQQDDSPFFQQALRLQPAHPNHTHLYSLFLPSILGLSYQLAAGKNYSTYPVKPNIKPISITPISGGEMKDSDKPNITPPSSISPVKPSTPCSAVDTPPALDKPKKRSGVRLIQSEVHTPQVTLYNVTTGKNRPFKWSSNDAIRLNANVISFSFFHAKALAPLEKDNWFLFDEEGKCVTSEEIKPVSDNPLAFFVLPVLSVLFSE